MKNKCLLKTLSLCLLCAGITAPIVGGLIAKFEANPTGVLAEEKDYIEGILGDGTFSVEDGNFIALENFLSAPNVGFSFEFKLLDNTPNKPCFKLYSGDTPVTNNLYLFSGDPINEKKPFTIYSNGTFNDPTSNCGRIVDLGEGWYRYELMGYEVALHPTNCNQSVDKTLTIDKIVFNGNWGDDYKNNALIRPFKKIYHYTGAKVAGTSADKFKIAESETVASGTLIKDFAPVKNWKNSGYGFFVNFKHGGTNLRAALYDDFIGGAKNTQKDTIGGDWVYGTSGDLTNQAYLYNNGVNAHGGKVFNLGNNWYRLELMFSDATSLTNTENYEFNSLMITWYSSVIGDRGIIDSYSYKLTTSVDGQTSDYVMEQGNVELPKNPVVAGKHFVGWYNEEDFQTKFTDTVLTEDKVVYAKFEEHTYSTYVSNNDTTHTYKCDCGAESTENHNLEEIKNTNALKEEASCETDAVYYKSCDCGYISSSETFTDVGSATGHVNLTHHSAVAPECEVDGNVEYWECGCGEKFSDSKGQNKITDIVDPAKGHTYVPVSKLDATIDEDGVEAHYECSDCDKVFTKEGEVYTETTLVSLVIPKTLPSYKENQLLGLANYKNLNDYRQAQKNEINSIISSTTTAVNNATDKASVDTLIANAKTALDAIKTDAQLIAEELVAYKKDKVAEIQSVYNALDLAKYNDENKQLLSSELSKAINNINQSSDKASVDVALENGKTAIANVKQKLFGCGGSVIAFSGIISLVSLTGSGLIFIRKKEK